MQEYVQKIVEAYLADVARKGAERQAALQEPMIEAAIRDEAKKEILRSAAIGAVVAVPLMYLALRKRR